MTTIIRKTGKTFDLLKLQQGRCGRYPHYLQSTADGRFDILFACPGESLVLQADGTLQQPGGQNKPAGDFLDNLDDWWHSTDNKTAATDLPFTGGWFLYLGYELAAQVEPSLCLEQVDPNLPVAFATRFAAAVIHDHHQGGIFIVCEPEAAGDVAGIEADIAAIPTTEPAAMQDVNAVDVSEEADRRYLDSVARIKDYIVEGDVFQVNLSRAWQIRLSQPADTLELFTNLGRHNPAPFSGIAHWRDTAIISSSPERLVSVRNGIVATRPIAGTRPRSDSRARDAAYSAELLSHPKECAEHIMLIDLERNDLGRICVPGSIEVNEFMVLESYAHVHHIVSNVRGRLCDDTTPGAILRAVFPGGTITGCPKVRCMEIIAELEQSARGAYTGSMGYLNHDGSMDMNILIRTMVSRGDRVELRAGAGIVADSIAVAELAETRAKARGLLCSLGIENHA